MIKTVSIFYYFKYYNTKDQAINIKVFNFVSKTVIKKVLSLNHYAKIFKFSNRVLNSKKEVMSYTKFFYKNVQS